MFGRILRFLVFCTFVTACAGSWIGIYMFFHGIFFKNPQELDSSILFFIPLFLVLILSPILYLGGKNEE